MGAVRMRVQTTDKNITSNPHDSNPSTNFLWYEKLFVFIINKVTIKIDASDDLKLKCFIKIVWFIWWMILICMMELMMDKHTAF